MPKQPTNEIYSFNDYFVDPSAPGVEVVVRFNGKDIPFRIRRSLTLKEKQKASDAAIAFEIDEEGKPTLSKMDQSAYTLEILVAGLLAWPFEYSPGQPVPINRETIEMLDGTLQSEVAARILGVGEAQAKALAPFGMKSGAPS